MTSILLVEDNVSMRNMLSQLLGEAGYQVESAGSAEEAIKKIRTASYELVLTDLRLPGKNGIEVLRSAKAHQPHTQVILLTAYGTVETAVSAIKQGAFDFLTKPFDNDHLLLMLKRALEFSRLESENTTLKEELGAAGKGMPVLVGRAPLFKEALTLAKKVAPSDSGVLITGESGTGKELFARLIHDLSGRRARPFVAVSCAALAEGLLESELFGHERGAFTGAIARHAGRFELAQDGTLLLDEVGDLTPHVQVKLLRVLQEKKYERVGGSETLPARCRLVAATHQDLEAACAAGTFREDLYYRLSVFPIHLPALRDRPGDIPLLAEHFLRSEARRAGKKTPALTGPVQELLKSYPWPGNIRELQNAVERALILCQGDAITVDDFSFLELKAGSGDIKSLGRQAKVRAEKEKILEVLKEMNGNKSKAAKKLGISYKTLLTRLKE